MVQSLIALHFRQRRENEMDQFQAKRLVAFVNSHDDGTPEPRAHYDAIDGRVRITSTCFLKDGRQSFEFDYVRTLGEARAVLGY